MLWEYESPAVSHCFGKNHECNLKSTSLLQDWLKLPSIGLCLKLYFCLAFFLFPVLLSSLLVSRGAKFLIHYLHMNPHLSVCFWSTQPKTFTHSLIVFKFNGHILVLLFEIQLLWCCQKSLLIELLPFFASVIVQFPSFLPISLEFPVF